MSQLEQAALIDQMHPIRFEDHEYCIAALERADISDEARAFLIQRHYDDIAALKAKESE